MSFLSSLLHWLRKNPLFVLASAAVAGTIIADLYVWQPGWGLSLITLFVWLPFVLKPSLLRMWPGVFMTLALLHSVRLAETFEHPLRTQLLALPDQPEQAAIQGRLLPWTEGAELDQATALCEVTHLRWGNTGPFLPMKARIKVRLPDGYLLSTPGFYEITGLLSLPKPPMNPGQFDPVTYGLRMGWVALLQAQSLTLLHEESPAIRFHLMYMAENCRQWITRQLSLGLENAGDHAAVILAMALGASDAAGDDIEDAFRDSGTLHVFAVSGLHVVMLATIASWLLRFIGARKQAVVIILLVFVYAFITGWRPSAARAAFMSAIILLAPLLNRKSRLVNSLGAAAILLLLLDSHQLFMPGFQLSFGVLLAIALMASWLMNWTAPWYQLDSFLPPLLATRSQRLGLWARKGGTSLLCVSAAAWVGSLPLTLGHFQTITPVAVIANILLVPASGLCLILSCTSLVLALFQQSWAVILVNQANAGLAKLMVMMAGGFADLPMANHTLDLRFQGKPAPVEMRVFHITGGGGASYLRGGDTRWLLDTGNVRAWRQVVRPFLRHEGINHLDGILLSHSDIAHVGATSWVIEAQHVPRIHTSRLEPWHYDPPFASMKKLDDLWQPDGKLWRRHRIDDILTLSSGPDMPVTAHILHPGGADLHEKADDRGLVVMIHIGPFRVLCLNDAGFVTEKRLLERRASLRCDILIRHQHRADVSGLTELLFAAQPQAVISSNDSYRIEELLPPRIRQHCETYHIPLFDLEATGSVGMNFQPHQVELKTFRNGQTLILQPRPEKQ